MEEIQSISKTDEFYQSNELKSKNKIQNKKAMSAVIKTITPFLNLELLLQALDAIDCKYTVNMQGNEIVTERVDYYGNQNFILISGRYVLQHDSSANRELYPWRNLNVKDYKTVSNFLEAVEINYNFSTTKNGGIRKAKSRSRTNQT